MNLPFTFSILFWLKKNRLKNGKAPLFIRLTVNGQRIEISTNREVAAFQWDAKAQKVKGASEEAKEINYHLAISKTKLLRIESELRSLSKSITAEAIKNEYLGIRPERKTVIQAFDFKLKILTEEVAADKKAIATLSKYEYTMEKIKNFLAYNYKKNVCFLDEVEYSFASDLEHYLSVVLKLDNNTTMKYISRTKTVFKMAVERNWLKTNPIAGFRCSFIEREPIRLELDELFTLYEKPMPVKRLEEARDIYVFMCFTGFAYIDTFHLTKEHIFWGIDKQQWITKDRQKTEGSECVPLLPIPLEIISKYKKHPYCSRMDKLLPVHSNQRFNGYLKEIAAICGINKELTTHTGRHTFATTVTLENDVPLETVGKMLGHRSIKSTQRYARVTKKKISNNMNDLKSKLFPVFTATQTGS